MIDGSSRAKPVLSASDAVASIEPGATVMIGGFGDVGVPFQLIDALVEHGAGELTLIANNCGTGERGLARLFQHRLVRRAYASFPAQPGNHHFAAAVESGLTELILVPQGTLVERIRAAAAGHGGFLTRTGVGTLVAAGKQVIEQDGRTYLLELPLRADVALVKAHIADAFGNLRYRLSSRNFNPIMAMAAAVTIAEVEQMSDGIAIEPDDVHTAGVFVDTLVLSIGQPA
jgi:3-oxoadipate CoA-transferase alpha subunit